MPLVLGSESECKNKKGLPAIESLENRVETVEGSRHDVEVAVRSMNTARQR